MKAWALKPSNVLELTDARHSRRGEGRLRRPSKRRARSDSNQAAASVLALFLLPGGRPRLFGAASLVAVIQAGGRPRCCLVHAPDVQE